MYATRVLTDKRLTKRTGIKTGVCLSVTKDAWSPVTDIS